MVEVLNIKLESENLVDRRIEQMRELFPEVFSEGGIDFDKLRLELGDKVDDGDERYAFTWPGKRDAIRQSQVVSTATLRPCVEKSRGRDGGDSSFDSDNIYIEGDNLEVLKLLQRAYHGKVKMIYIDPPYNTGHDFVYRDSFGDTIGNYRRQTGLSGQSNADTSGRYHSAWCSMMYPRIKLARELLSDDGLLFISINSCEETNLSKICDELFGENNRVMDFVWKNKYGPGALTKGAASLHEYVLCYAKNFPQNIEAELSEQEMEKYNKTDEQYAVRGGYITQPLATKSKDDRPNLVYPLMHNGIEIWPDKQWIWSKDRLYAAYERGEVVVNDKNGKYSVRFKQYLRDENGVLRKGKPLSLINSCFNQDGTKEIETLFGSRVFDFPKPTRLIRDFVMYRLNEIDDSDFIVMDFFSGSASTADAVMQANTVDGGHRKYILVQLPEECSSTSVAAREGYKTICEVGEERIRRAGDKIKAELEDSNRQLKLGEEPKQLPDIGFRVFKLDESGIRKSEPGQLLVDCVKPDRSELDIVFEMMLKWGLELTLPVELEELVGYPCYIVAYGELVCCLAPGLSIDVLETIAALDPRRVLMLDSILDDSLKLNAVQIFKRVEERTGREVELRTV